MFGVEVCAYAVLASKHFTVFAQLHASELTVQSWPKDNIAFNRMRFYNIGIGLVAILANSAMFVGLGRIFRCLFMSARVFYSVRISNADLNTNNESDILLFVKDVYKAFSLCVPL